MDARLNKLMALKKKGDKGLSDTDVIAKKAALGDLIGMAKEAMGSKLSGLKKVTVASDSDQGLEKGLELAKKKLGEMDANDESEISKTGHGELAEEESEEEDESESPEDENMENMSEEELQAMLEKLKSALAAKKMAK